MHGSEIVAKDVLEYVVFEKFIANEYGKWRIHGKIIPDWLPARDPSKQTFIQKEEADVASAKITETTSASKISSSSSEQTNTLVIPS